MDFIVINGMMAVPVPPSFMEFIRLCGAHATKEQLNQIMQGRMYIPCAGGILQVKIGIIGARQNKAQKI